MLPHQLHIALNQATNYKIKRTTKGYAAWRFRQWDRKQGGWTILAHHKTHEQAPQDIQHRLDLEREPPKPTVIMATITYVESYDDWLGPWI